MGAVVLPPAWLACMLQLLAPRSKKPFFIKDQAAPVLEWDFQIYHILQSAGVVRRRISVPIARLKNNAHLLCSCGSPSVAPSCTNQCHVKGAWRHSIDRDVRSANSAGAVSGSWSAVGISWTAHARQCPASVCLLSGSRRGRPGRSAKPCSSPRPARCHRLCPYSPIDPTQPATDFESTYTPRRHLVSGLL
jgi:hypothetical protein